MKKLRGMKKFANSKKKKKKGYIQEYPGEMYNEQALF